MRADVHRKKSNRFITSKEEKNEEDRRTVAIVLLLEWTGVETVSLSLSVSWCISYQIKIDRKRTDRPQKERQDVKRESRKKHVTSKNQG
jgi:hypothetical protein